jgi:hypothetical protein
MLEVFLVMLSAVILTLGLVGLLYVLTDPGDWRS